METKSYVFGQVWLVSCRILLNTLSWIPGFSERTHHTPSNVRTVSGSNLQAGLKSVPLNGATPNYNLPRASRFDTENASSGTNKSQVRLFPP